MTRRCQTLPLPTGAGADAWWRVMGLLCLALAATSVGCTPEGSPEPTEDGQPEAAQPEVLQAQNTGTTEAPSTDFPLTFEEWAWDLPDDVVPPPVPGDNPMSHAKAELGRSLFFETRISLGGEMSCGSCHEQHRGFAVAEATHAGATGEHTPRNAPGLANIAYARYLTWGNLTLPDLEQHMLNPLFGDSPIELGAGFVENSSNHYDTRRLRTLVQQEPAYAQLFEASFPDEDPLQRINWDNAIKAIACYQRSLLSFESPWDRWLDGDEEALDPAQQRGRGLFFSERLACNKCHAGRLLSLAFPTDGSIPTREASFRNTGLYNTEMGEFAYLDGSRSHYPPPNIGIGEFSQDFSDDGKHRIPSLRNVALTAPYMHDGSVADLDAALEHYARGGRLTETGPHAGDGSQHPNKDALIAGFSLSPSERSDLLAFLHAFTDEVFVSDPRFTAP